MRFDILTDKQRKVSGYDEGNIYPSIIVAQTGGCDYTVNISQDFGEGYTFDSVIALLSNATELDNITFNINSRGGYLFSLIALQNAIEQTKAAFHMVLLGEACSAGGALFLTEGATSYSIGRNTMLMIHPVQAGVGYGSVGESVIRLEANVAINDRFVRETYRDFLTEEEINDVLKNNREIYLFDNEINERLAHRIEVRGKQIAEHLDKIEHELDDVGFDGLSDDDLKTERSAITGELQRRAKAAKKAIK